MNKLNKFIAKYLAIIIGIVGISATNVNAYESTNQHMLMQDQNDTLPFPVTIRDFRADNVIFEPNKGSIPWLGSGMVQKRLGTNKKPVFKAGNKNDTIDVLSDELWSKKREIIYGKEINPGGEDIKYEDVLIKKGDLKDAENFYEANKNKGYTEIKPTKDKEKSKINTAYRYIYYHMNKLFEDVDGLNTKDSNVIDKLDLKKVNDIYIFHLILSLWIDFNLN